MGRLIFKQPNGLYGRWSGIVDAFTWYNFSKNNVKNYKANMDKYIVDESDFKDYDKYDLDYIINNEGFMMAYRALQEGDVEKDLFIPIKEMGGSEEQLNRMKEIVAKAKIEFEENNKEEE